MNQRTSTVERREDASLTITGKASSANADRDTQESHAVSLLATHLALLKLKTTLHSGNMAASRKLRKLLIITSGSYAAGNSINS